MLLNQNGLYIAQERIHNKKIVMYGASTRNKQAIEELGIKDNIICYIDSDHQKDGKMLDGYVIHSIDYLSALYDYIVLSVLTTDYMNVAAALMRYGVEECWFYFKEWFDIEKAAEDNVRIIKKKQQYKYLHIFNNDKFIIPFYQMIEEKFDISEHLFIVAWIAKGDISHMLPFIKGKNDLYNNILLLDEVHGLINGSDRLIPDELDCNKILYSTQMGNICSGVKKILLHSAFFGNFQLKYVQNLVTKHSYKMAWLCWGNDAYYNGNSVIVNTVLNKVKYVYASSARIDAITKEYKIAVTESKATYCYISKNVSLHKKSDETFRILLGHSAVWQVNHKLGFDMLYKYKDEDIKIYTPLTYGDDAYRNSIVKQGYEMYGSKFVPLIEHMDLDTYYNFLTTMDLAVLPMTLMLAETTVRYLSAVGKKCLMSKEMMRYFADSGVDVDDIELLNKMSYDDLKRMTQSVKKCDDRLERLNADVVKNWEIVLEV